MGIFIGPEGGFAEEEIQAAAEDRICAHYPWQTDSAHRDGRAGSIAPCWYLHWSRKGRRWIKDSWKHTWIIPRPPDALESVARYVRKTMLEDYGNPSSKHLKGVEAERYLRESREIIAKTLKVNEKEIYFTSGGTESNNWALVGAAMANQPPGKPHHHHCSGTRRCVAAHALSSGAGI